MSMQYRRGGVFRDMDSGEPNKDPATQRFIISTDRLDRYRTRIRQDWIDDGRLMDFRANPVAPWSHDYDGMSHGQWRDDFEYKVLRSGETATLLTLDFDMEDEESARIAGKYARGVMNCVSVGFRNGSDKKLSEYPQDHPWHDERGLELADNTLYECSLVLMPGNGGASKYQGRGLSWAGVALMETAPEEVRAELLRLLTEDAEVKALVREMAGDCRTVEEAVHEARATHPLGWMISQKP